MNITDKYNLSMGSANLTKLENAKKQYGNSKFSIDETPTENVNNAISKYDKDFEKKRLRQVSEDFEALAKVFEEKGIKTDEAEVIRRPEMVTEITDPAIARQVLRLVERMEELDDVQLVTANYEIADSIADQLEEE